MWARSRIRSRGLVASEAEPPGQPAFLRWGLPRSWLHFALDGASVVCGGNLVFPCCRWIDRMVVRWQILASLVASIQPDLENLSARERGAMSFLDCHSAGRSEFKTLPPCIRPFLPHFHSLTVADRDQLAPRRHPVLAEWCTVSSRCVNTFESRFSPMSSAIVVRPLNPVGPNTASGVIERDIPFRYHQT